MRAPPPLRAIRGGVSPAVSLARLQRFFAGQPFEADAFVLGAAASGWKA
jgi:hypothetical protein